MLDSQARKKLILRKVKNVSNSKFVLGERKVANAKWKRKMEASVFGLTDIYFFLQKKANYHFLNQLKRFIHTSLSAHVGTFNMLLF